jgi:hypothetical protein
MGYDSDKMFTEKPKKILFLVFFSENRALCEIMWKKTPSALLRLHCFSGYANAPTHYVTRTLPIWLQYYSLLTPYNIVLLEKPTKNYIFKKKSCLSQHLYDFYPAYDNRSMVFYLIQMDTLYAYLLHGAESSLRS